MISTMSGLLSRPVLPKRAWSTTFPDLSKSHRIATFLCHWGFVVSRYDEYCLEEILHQQSPDVPLVPLWGPCFGSICITGVRKRGRSMLMTISAKPPSLIAMTVCQLCWRNERVGRRTRFWVPLVLTVINYGQFIIVAQTPARIFVIYSLR